MLVKNVIKMGTHKGKYNFKQAGLTGAVCVLEAAAFSLRKGPFREHLLSQEGLAKSPRKSRATTPGQLTRRHISRLMTRSTLLVTWTDL